jgi:DNA-3-methyladenine glycosylase
MGGRPGTELSAATERVVGVPLALPASFYDRPAEQVARDLLGAIVVSDLGGGRTAGRIVETEAYPGPHDPASHAAARIGRTRRNEAMHGPPGIAYVYRIYGLHWCLNAVTGTADRPAAVLLRALEPVAGRSAMARRRGRARDLANGPARLTQALAVDGASDGRPLTGGALRIVEGTRVTDGGVATGPRIGVTRAREWPLRFWVRGDPHVSR